MRTITLEDGTKIKISQESYESLKGAVTKKPWVPESGDWYFFLAGNGVSRTRWNGASHDKRRLERGSVFRTREEAEVVDQKRLAKKRIRDHAGDQGWVDWGNDSQIKYCITHQHADKTFYRAKHRRVQPASVAFYKTWEHAEEAIEKHGDDYKIVFGMKGD